MSLCLYTFSYRKQEILGILADYSATAKLKTTKKWTRPRFWKSPCSLLTIVSTGSKDSVIVVVTWLFASLLILTLGDARFVHLKKEAWQSLVGVWLQRLAFCENESCENFFWMVWEHFCKILHQWKFSTIQCINVLLANQQWNSQVKQLWSGTFVLLTFWKLP